MTEYERNSLDRRIERVYSLAKGFSSGRRFKKKGSTLRKVLKLHVDQLSGEDRKRLFLEDFGTYEGIADSFRNTLSADEVTHFKKEYSGAFLTFADEEGRGAIFSGDYSGLGVESKDKSLRNAILKENSFKFSKNSGYALWMSRNSGEALNRSVNHNYALWMSRNSGHALWMSRNFGKALWYSKNSGRAPLWYSKNGGHALWMSRNSGEALWHSKNSGYALANSKNFGGTLWFSENSGYALANSKNFGDALAHSKNSYRALMNLVKTN